MTTVPIPNRSNSIVIGCQGATKAALESAVDAERFIEELGFAK